MTVCWVIGQRGLLGSALTRRVSQRDGGLVLTSPPMSWHDPLALAGQIAGGVAQLGEAAAGGPWRIFWAAGIGTMSTPAQSLEVETVAFGQLLRSLAATRGLRPDQGSVALASSAGAIWAGSCGDVIDEATPIAPTTPYAHAKLMQEDLLARFARTHPDMRTLSARISTLYGFGQAAHKKQGLLTHLARNIVRGQTTTVFVSLDTIRDYIHADDAADEMVTALAMASPGPEPAVKIIASERPATIAEIVTIFKRIARRNPRIVASQAPASRLYLHRQEFRSRVLPQARCQSPRSLLIGISQIVAAERASYAGGPR